MMSPTRSRRSSRVSRSAFRAFSRPLTLTLLATAFGGLAATGCRTTNIASGPALGVAGYTYLYGTGSQGFPYPLAEVKRAVFQAMADQRMRGLDETREPGAVTNISAIAADRRMVNISIVSQPTFSLVSARFGGVGDRAQTRAFFDLVGRYLTSPSGSLTPNGIEPPESSTDLPDPNAVGDSKAGAESASTTPPEPARSNGGSGADSDDNDNLPAFPQEPDPAPAPAARPGANGVKSSYEGESPKPPFSKGVSDDVMLRDVTSAGYRDSPIP